MPELDNIEDWLADDGDSWFQAMTSEAVDRFQTRLDKQQEFYAYLVREGLE